MDGFVVRVNENIIPREKFERYCLPFNFARLLGRKKDDYIFSELIKRHPCFSSDFSYDSKILIGRKGFINEVIVLHKEQLIAFRKRNLLRKLFGMKFEGVKGKRFSLIRENEKSIMFFFLIMLLFFCIAKVFTPQKNTGVEEDKQEIKVIENFPGKLLVLKDVLCAIKSKEGKIDFISWKCDGFTESFQISVNSLFPEEIEAGENQFVISNLIYKDMKPSFSFSYTSKIQSFPLENMSFSDPFVIAFRKWAEENKCKIIEESLQPYKVTFQIAADRLFHIKELTDLEQESKVLCGSFESSLNEDILAIQISFYRSLQKVFEDEENFESDILKIIGENAEVFYSKKEIDVETASFVKNEKKSESKNISVLSEQIKDKIGQVLYPDGRTVIYYKNEKGKLKSMVISE